MSVFARYAKKSINGISAIEFAEEIYHTGLRMLEENEKRVLELSAAIRGGEESGTAVPSQGGKIAYIDLAKGLCIIFVIFGHINYLLYPELLQNPFSNATSSFRMPIYFFLSGLFFKTYGGFLDLTLRKTNKLLVPFVFWHLTLSLGLAWVIGIVTTGSWSSEPVKENFLAILHNGNPLNIPLWLLLALFVTNILFYCLFAITEKLKPIPQVVSLTVGAILSGVIGQILRTYEVNLPQHTKLLSAPMSWKDGAVIAFGLVMIAIAFKMNVYFIDLRLNAVFVPTPLAYLFAFAGTSLILYVSKAIGHIPIISYIGRYSFVVITSLCIACIPLCLKFLPKFTAQKGLIKMRV